MHWEPEAEIRPADERKRVSGSVSTHTYADTHTQLFTVRVIMNHDITGVR